MLALVRRLWSSQPTMIVNTVPPGLTVSCRPEAWRLARIVTVAVLPALCSVPEDGCALTKPLPLATEIDQVTGPPCAVSVIVVPLDETVSEPPGGLTTSVPAAGGGGGCVGAGVGGAVVGAEVGVGDAVVGVAFGVGRAVCAVVGDCDTAALGAGVVAAAGSPPGARVGAGLPPAAELCPLLPDSAKATAAMTPANTTLAAMTVRPSGAERQASFTAACSPAVAAFTGLGKPSGPNGPMRPSTAAWCAVALGLWPLASASVWSLSAAGGPAASRRLSAAPATRAAPGDRPSSTAGRSSTARRAVQVPHFLMCGCTHQRSSGVRVPSQPASISASSAQSAGRARPTSSTARQASSWSLARVTSD